MQDSLSRKVKKVTKERTDCVKTDNYVLLSSWGNYGVITQRIDNDTFVRSAA